MVKNYLSSTFKISFLLLAVSLFSFQTSFGQCTFGNDEGGFDPENNFEWAQSFTAECDGFLEYVEWITGSGGTQQARTLEIFQGSTVAGTPIFTQDFEQMTFGAAGESFRINLESEFPVLDGDVYTYLVRGVTVNLLVSITDPYPFGEAFENGSNFGGIVDFVFNVSITDVLANDTFDTSQIALFPSPAHDVLNFALGRAYDDVQIATYSITGALVQNDSTQNSDHMLMDISQLSNGIYFAVITTESGEATVRFAKQ